ncbi:hypothetical protein K469DRAFT_396100 [Zopfia rhizophila CBS 207.26]|uniref:Uncharacterized protein n=1 Tax=Zopfia rhizophila CBS 207.26 TaxID=1314779 RepID=A0A6A6DF35_9PEZI|nr:hypothetical protein K469DRAFT_396100 [Zopfia rhizophila CBS 207.26]
MRATAGKPVIKRRFHRYLKGTIAQAAELKQAKQDLADITNARQRRQKRQQTDRRQIQSGGILYAKDGREAVIERNKKDGKIVEESGVNDAPTINPAPRGTYIQWQLPKI